MSQPAPDDLLLAVDGGQTATKALLARLDGTILGSGRGTPSDHFHSPGGYERNRAGIQSAILAAYEAASLIPGHIRAIGLGLTGAYANSGAPALVDGIVREIINFDELVVVSDVVTNLTGASTGQPGVVVIAGGGSTAFGRGDDGRECLVGGFGYLVGDEGSAFDIGRCAVAHAARMSDGRDTPTALLDMVLAEFGATTIREVTYQIYAAGFSRERLSLLAPRVAVLAETGDPCAHQIMTSAGQQLGLLALAAVRGICHEGAPATVYPTGGVFAAGEAIMQPFLSVLRGGWHAVTVASPRFPPVIGALILARQRLALPVAEPWLSRVAATLG